ncbi:hypothetical protein ACSQ67_022450 [Phaseolus vulgaris]
MLLRGLLRAPPMAGFTVSPVALVVVVASCILLRIKDVFPTTALSYRLLGLASPCLSNLQKHGHSADVCWQRYYPSSSNNMTANYSSFSSRDCVPSDASILGAPSSMDDPP